MAHVHVEVLQREKAKTQGRHEKLKRFFFMSSVNVHLHYLAVLGMPRNRSKPPHASTVGNFFFSRHRMGMGKLSPCAPLHRKKYAFDHLRSQDGMHYSSPHTHTHLH